MAHISTAERSIQFVEAAVRVIADQGVANATTRRIAEAADAPLASLHYCFRDKDSLFHAVFEHLTEGAVQAFASVEPERLSVTAEHYIRYSTDWIVQNPDYALAQLDLHLWMSRNRPESATELADGYFRAVAAILHRAAGPTVSEEGAMNLASVLSGAIDGIVTQWAAHRDSSRVDAYAETFCAGIPALCRHIELQFAA